MRIFPLLLVGLAFVAAESRAAEPYWNMFRGPDGSGHFLAKDLPIEFGEGKNVIWKNPLDGKAWSSPVVWGEQVWVTNASEDGKQLDAVGFNLETGKIIHNIRVFDIAEPMFCYPFNSYGSPTPAIEEGRVYVSYGSAGTACLDTATGQILWKRQDLKCDHFRGPGSSPVLHDGLLLLQFDGFDVQFVVALDAATGKTRWIRKRAFDFRTDNGDNKKGYGTPSVFRIEGRNVAVCPAAVATEAFDADTGELLWTVRTGGMNASARPLMSAGLIYLTNGMGRLVVVKPGVGDITADNIVWDSNKGVSKRTSPLLVDGLLYMVTDDGIANCFEAQTGDKVWTHRLGGEFAASPIYADGKIYFSSMEGEVTVIAPGRKYHELAKNSFEEGFMATPAVAGNSLIFRTKKAVYRVGK